MALISAGAVIVAAVIGLVATLVSSSHDSADPVPTSGSTLPTVEPSGGSLRPTASSSMSGATVAETTGSNTDTHTNYRNAGGSSGEEIPAGKTVAVICRVEGFPVQDGDVWWYRIADAPWSGSFYASADAFFNNGATSGSLIGTPAVDEAVPVC